MKFSVLAETLHTNLSFVNRAVSSRSQLQVLFNILLEVKGKTLALCATDLEVGIQTEQEVSVEKEGAVTIPARQFTELISSLPPGEITIETKDSSVEVRGEKTKSTFQTLPKEEFPKLYEERGERVAVFAKEEMTRDFGRVVFAASSDVGRAALSGVLLQQDKEGLLLVATDGYRLSLKRQEAKKTEETREKRLLIVPARVVREAVFVKEGGEVSLFVSRANNQVMFSKRGASVVGRIIEANFPDFQKILPTQVETKATFDKEEMEKAVKISLVFAREAANIVRFSLSKNGITLSANTPSVGENTVVVAATVNGEENEIAFNARYISDFLANVEGDEVVFEMTGPLNPGVFKIKGDESFLHLIMPIRVQT